MPYVPFAPCQPGPIIPEPPFMNPPPPIMPPVIIEPVAYCPPQHLPGPHVHGPAIGVQHPATQVTGFFAGQISTADAARHPMVQLELHLRGGKLTGMTFTIRGWGC